MTEQWAFFTQSGPVQGTGLDNGRRVRNADDHDSRLGRVHLVPNRAEWGRGESSHEQGLDGPVSFADSVSLRRTGGSGLTKGNR